MNLNFEDIAKLGELATLFEVSAYPKPGNVHRTQNFNDMTFEDFLTSSVVIREYLRKAASLANMYYSDSPEKIGIGKCILECVESTNKLVKTNTNLGISMLLIPIAASFGAMTNSETNDSLPTILDNIIKNTEVDDAINLTKAINYASAGGLDNKPVNYDVKNKDVLSKLKKDNVNLHKLLTISSDYDYISYELTNSLQITLDYGVPTYKKYDGVCSQNDVTLEVYLKLLSHVPDTLITRKYGQKISSSIKNLAKSILETTEIATKERYVKLEKLDKDLRKNGYNPGTTADFTAATLFVSLVDKYSRQI